MWNATFSCKKSNAHFIDIFTCTSSTGRSEVSHNIRATTFKAGAVGVMAQYPFFLPSAYTGLVSLSHCFLLFPNSTPSGHRRNLPVYSFNYGFSWLHWHKCIRDTALRHEVNLKAGPKMSQESQRALQEHFQHLRHASPRGLSCTAGSNHFWGAAKNVQAWLVV